MKNIAIYPGTFDPITFGHIDVIKKALKFVDKVIVGISDGNQKNFLFSIDERVKIVKKAVFNDLNFKICNEQRTPSHFFVWGSFQFCNWVNNIKLVMIN